MAFLDFGVVKTLEPQDYEIWRDLTRAIMAGDKDKVIAAMVSLDVIIDITDFDQNHFYEYARLAFKPFWYEGDFEFTHAYLKDLWHTTLIENPNLLKMNQSRGHLFLNQLLCGLFSILTQMGAKSNWHKRVRDYL